MSHQHPRPKRPVIRWDGLASQTRVEEERVVQSHKRVVQSHKRVVQSHKHSNNKKRITLLSDCFKFCYSYVVSRVQKTHYNLQPTAGDALPVCTC